MAHECGLRSRVLSRQVHRRLGIDPETYRRSLDRLENIYAATRNGPRAVQGGDNGQYLDYAIEYARSLARLHYDEVQADETKEPAGGASAHAHFRWGGVENTCLETETVMAATRAAGIACRVACDEKVGPGTAGDTDTARKEFTNASQLYGVVCNAREVHTNSAGRVHVTEPFRSITAMLNNALITTKALRYYRMGKLLEASAADLGLEPRGDKRTEYAELQKMAAQAHNAAYDVMRTQGVPIKIACAWTYGSEAQPHIFENWVHPSNAHVHPSDAHVSAVATTPLLAADVEERERIIGRKGAHGAFFFMRTAAVRCLMHAMLSSTDVVTMSNGLSLARIAAREGDHKVTPEYIDTLTDRLAAAHVRKAGPGAAEAIREIKSLVLQPTSILRRSPYEHVHAYQCAAE